MAGIGFTLKKLYRNDEYSSRFATYLYASMVTAGPWIATVVTVNALTFYAQRVFEDISEMGLFMGSIVYAFIFSQIITAPFQLVITRYISDQLYVKTYNNIRASYNGLKNIILIITIATSVLYLSTSNLPLYYKYLSSVLFIIISLMWVTMVYLSAIKNYSIITKAYLVGGLIAIVASILTVGDLGSVLNHVLKLLNFSIPVGPILRIPFKEIQDAGNLLSSYLLGMIVTYSVLIFSFVNTFTHSNNNKYDFLKYLNFFPSLFLSGLFYTLGLWSDDLIMWTSEFGRYTHYYYNVYKYAPLYDNAVFLAYLTVIPTMVLFVIAIETEFYDHYRKYYSYAGRDGTYDQLVKAKKEMERSVWRQIIYTMETQTIFTVIVIILSGPVFSYFNQPEILKDIFRICALGALCNIFVMIIFLVLLYFEARKEALFVTFLFFISNVIFTLLFIPLGEEFFGFGYFVGSFVSLVVAVITLYRYFNKLMFHTFARLPLFTKEKKGVFVTLSRLSNKLAKRYNEKDGIKQLD
jgi:uncharacterized membrane protein